jgi:hypothetical protein
MDCRTERLEQSTLGFAKERMGEQPINPILISRAAFSSFSSFALTIVATLANEARASSDRFNWCCAIARTEYAAASGWGPPTMVGWPMLLVAQSTALAKRPAR